jgi:hypothetical protein
VTPQRCERLSRKGNVFPDTVCRYCECAILRCGSRWRDCPSRFRRQAQFYDCSEGAHEILLPSICFGFGAGIYEELPLIERKRGLSQLLRGASLSWSDPQSDSTPAPLSMRINIDANGTRLFSSLVRRTLKGLWRTGRNGLYMPEENELGQSEESAVTRRRKDGGSCS